MGTKAVEAVLNDYRDRMADSLATDISRAQRETDSRNLRIAEDARAELASIRKAAKGLGQRLREAPWDQDAWDEGLSLMESIAKEES